ncbi:MAG TPA: GxxExxY protein [Sedimentisphaerales bacterium]|nr:GxxExxY protein [Sedimentisphaerales bacterium]
MKHEQLTEAVIGSAIEVHRELGPGLLESAYEKCLAWELNKSQIPFVQQAAIPVAYKGVQIDCGYRADILVDSKVIIELKSVDRILPIHEAQLLTYMKLTGVQVGLLINFNVRQLTAGIKRMVL